MASFRENSSGQKRARESRRASMWSATQQPANASCSFQACLMAADGVFVMFHLALPRRRRTPPCPVGRGSAARGHSTPGGRYRTLAQRRHRVPAAQRLRRRVRHQQGDPVHQRQVRRAFPSPFRDWSRTLKTRQSSHGNGRMMESYHLPAFRRVPCPPVRAN